MSSQPTHIILQDSDCKDCCLICDTWFTTGIYYTTSTGNSLSSIASFAYDTLKVKIVQCESGVTSLVEKRFCCC